MAKASTAAKTVAKKRRRGRKPREEPVYYVVQIDGWDWGYSFGLNKLKDSPEVYGDYRHLELRGTLLRPSRLKVDRVGLTFLPDEDLNREARARHSEGWVGRLQLYRGAMDGLFGMPADVLPPLLTMLAAGRIKFAVIEGKKLHYGNTAVNQYRLEMDLGEDDLPPEE